MITLETAIKIAQGYVTNEEKSTRYDLVLLIDSIMEFELGWVFYYQTKEFVETGNFLQMLGGNAPIIVNKFDGNIYETGTGFPIEKYLEEYKAKHGYNGCE